MAIEVSRSKLSLFFFICELLKFNKLWWVQCTNPYHITLVKDLATKLNSVNFLKICIVYSTCIPEILARVVFFGWGTLINDILYTLVNRCTWLLGAYHLLNVSQC